MAFLTGVSRFKNTDLIKSRSGKDTYGRVSGFDALKNITDDESNYIKFVVSSGYEGKASLIASDNYGDPHLEWVLIFANHVLNPFNWPKAGETIIIPKLSFIRTLF
jgi:hypothetical protein